MNKHKAMPNIRFKGFEDEWKEKKFGSLFNHNSGTSIEKYFNSDGKYKVISIGSYGKNSKYIDQGIRVDLNSVTKSHLVDKNDLTMVLNDKTSDGQIIGRVLLINKSNEYVINQRTERLIPRNINSKFAFIYLNGPIRKSIKKMVQGGTQIYVNYSSIEKINAIVPKTMEEQRKIGDFFSKLDKLLDLQQQKIDKLELLKKTLLQKLFPKHDAKIPELRFKGFNDEWKGMKIGSLFDHKSGTSIEKYFNSDGKYKVISIGSYGKNSKYIDQGIRVNLNSVTKSHLVDKNDLTMVLNDKTSDGQIIGRVLLINKSNEFVINQRTERLIPRNINSKFAFTYLNGPIRKSIKKMVQGGTQIYINYSSIEKIDILVPKTIEEEQKIGNFLFKVDQLIELENKKLQDFQQVKKCLLQNMFVE